ncbi:hypothetical protein Tco_1011644 [Tanacetum coccineum]
MPLALRLHPKAEEDEETEVAKESEDMTLSIMKGDNGKGKEAKHDHLKVNKDDKGKGKVHDIQTRVKKLKVDLARAIKAKQAEHDKGKGKQLDDVDLDAYDDDLDAHDDDDLDALDLENIIKKLEEDFGRLLKAKKAELKAKEERPTTSRAPTTYTSNAQAASTSAPKGRKIAMTRCVLDLRALDYPTSPPPSATRKRKSKK